MNAFAQAEQESLFFALHEGDVLTPHEGEFERMFPALSGELEHSRESASRCAAEQSGAVVVLKGARTIIAAPDGRLVVNDVASSYLATAGAGDVLSGIIAGLIAQGMSAFDAACAGVWIHGKASEKIAPVVVCDDLVKIIPKVLKEILGIHKKLG